MELLCSAAYRPINDEMTTVYILNAITKLHASLGF